MKIDFSPLHGISPKHGFSKKQFGSFSQKIPDFLKKIEKRDQGFYRIIDDEKILESIQNYAKNVAGKFSDIVICGIGGSALGPITLRDALTGFFQKNEVNLHVLENIDPDFLTEAIEFLDLSKTLFLVVSKSGGTPETLAQYFLFRSLVDAQKLEVSHHFVFITDPQKSLLLEIAKQEKITCFPIPPNVGGRFSVQSAVGLLPAALMGVDIKSLINGFRKTRDEFLNDDFDQNLPFQLAVAQFLSYRQGKDQNIIFPYHTKLRTFGAWCVQLIAESTGKEKISKTSQKNVGITPIPALGVTDQHSQLQLFAQGKNNKLILFIKVQNFKNHLKIPKLFNHEKTDFLEGKTFEDLLQAELMGTSKALSENDRPNLIIQIPSVNEENLGRLFMLFEGATAFLGEFLGINAFDQPGVERSKILTREIMNNFLKIND